ncbi:MAG: amino-acid N-acetyltransferase [Betaproteobacteria bacterium]|nr:amino-acid N-acetyltransferase [Betaproteobacteria bacterium]
MSHELASGGSSVASIGDYQHSGNPYSYGSAPAVAASQFVYWLRSVAPYIHNFRHRTFVVGFPGELVQAGRLNALIQDIALLTALGIRIVVVHGCRPQVEEQLRLRGLEGRFAQGMRITDSHALECLKEASGEIRLDIEAAFSQGLPNTPMANSAIRVISGNLVSARPVGIVQGVDFQHTGLVRKIDRAAIRSALDYGSVVLLSPLGFSPTGEAFNLSMEEIAVATAIALDADKLIFLTEIPGMVSAGGEMLSEISEANARELLASKDALQASDTARAYLQAALRAAEGGVERSHLVPFDTDGSLLLELFLHDGVGSMVVEETLEALREASIDDVGGILSIIRPLEDDGTLIRRDPGTVERDIERFSVIEHDGVIFGCAALFPFPESGMGEMACVAVNPGAQGQGDGERLLRHIEQRARAAGLKRLFVLTTRTMHWFLKRGFVQVTPDELPPQRRGLYDRQRNSQVLMKDLSSPLKDIAV